jgi:hypothetical protein
MYVVHVEEEKNYDGYTNTKVHKNWIIKCDLLKKALYTRSKNAFFWKWAHTTE